MFKTSFIFLTQVRHTGLSLSPPHRLPREIYIGRKVGTQGTGRDEKGGEASLLFFSLDP